MHVWFIRFNGHPGEIACKGMVRPLFLLKKFFCLVEILKRGFGAWFFWYLWIGRAKNPGPGSSHHLSVEVFNVGGWLTHGDLALDAGLDFLAVTKHRLISARVRSEWARLRAKGVASFWAPASQDASHVGYAGVGVVSLRGASLTLPTCASAHFKAFFDCGRVVRCTLPLGAGRFMHLVVLYGYQGADSDPEQLALTDQLFDAALAESSVVARGQPCMLVGDFNVEPTKIPCLAKFNGLKLRKRSVCLSVCKLIWLGWLGKHLILMKRFLSCGGRFLWCRSRRIWMPVMGQPQTCCA